MEEKPFLSWPRHFAGYTRILNKDSRKYYYEPNNATKPATWNAPQAFLDAMYESKNYTFFPAETVAILQKIDNDIVTILNEQYDIIYKSDPIHNSEEEKKRIDDKVAEYDTRYNALKELRKQVVKDAVEKINSLDKKGGKRRRKTRKARKLSKKLKS